MYMRIEQEHGPGVGDQRWRDNYGGSGMESINRHEWVARVTNVSEGHERSG